MEEAKENGSRWSTTCIIPTNPYSTALPQLDNNKPLTHDQNRVARVQMKLYFAWLVGPTRPKRLTGVSLWYFACSASGVADIPRPGGRLTVSPRQTKLHPGKTSYPADERPVTRPTAFGRFAGSSQKSGIGRAGRFTF